MPNERDRTLVLRVRIPIGIVTQACPLADGLDERDFRRATKAARRKPIALQRSPSPILLIRQG